MFDDIAKGKRDLPLLIPIRKAEFDIDEVDGAEYMLNHDFEGCFCFFCTKQIGSMMEAEAILEDYGKIPAVSGFCKMGPDMVTIVGVQIQPYLREYDKTYQIHIEGVMDIDGNKMKPMDFSIHTLPKSMPGSELSESDKVTLETAREGMVLLKNENQVLPLGENAKINIFGSGFAKFRLGSSGAGRINPRYTIRLFDGIEKYSTLQINPELKMFYTVGTNMLPGREVMQRASLWSQTAVIAITRGTSENFDNLAAPGEFYLTSEETLMIQEVSKMFENTILLINSGYPIDVRYTEIFSIKSVLWTGLCGMNGGRAAAEILEGIVNPSGKLPDTWSLSWEEIPSSVNFYQPANLKERISGNCTDYITTAYEEGLYIGYRYFDTFSRPVAYGFGHGLSYTRFQCEYELTEWNKAGTLDSIAAKVRAVIKNTGDRSGKEVVQVYVKIPDGKLEQPNRRLVGFGKTKLLLPGEQQCLEMNVQFRQLVSFDTDRAEWICEAGTWEFYAGTSLEASQRIASVNLGKEKVFQQSKNYMSLPDGFKIRTLSKKDINHTWPSGKLSGKTGVNYISPKNKWHCEPELHPLHKKMTETLISWEMVCENADLLEDFVLQLNDYELSRLCVCADNGWGMEKKGEAGKLYQLKNYNNPEFIFADGNNGVNLRISNIGCPTSITVCATFNEELAYRTGAVIAEEAKALGIHGILGPGANLHRNPLCGRNAEYFSEDPLLAGRMAGQQSKGLEEHGIVSCMKHLTANNCESSRLRNNSIIDERTLRELYLKVFEEAFQVHKPGTLMTAYNAVNGIYCAENEEMLQKIFIEELGFNGFIMTDWTSCDTCDIVNAVAAGNGWITPGGMDDTQTLMLEEGIRNGRIERKRIEKNVYRMLNTVLRFTSV